MVKCKNCGRELKNKTSIIDGFGPVCYVKLFGHKVVFREEKVEKIRVSRRRELEESNMPLWNVEEIFK